MRTRTLTWMFVALTLLLLPALATGCGADDTEHDAKVGIYTIGPGNLDHFPTASGT